MKLKTINFFSLIFIFFLSFVAVRPLSIKLVGDNRPLSADSPVNVSCRVIGAKPPPIITWWKDATQLTDAKQIVSCPSFNISVIGFNE